MNTLYTLFAVCFFSICINYASSQTFKAGSCPSVNAVKFFDINKYFGRYYQYAGYSGVFDSGKCIVFNIQAPSEPEDSDGFTTYTVKRSSVNEDGTQHKLHTQLSLKNTIPGVSGHFATKFEELIEGVGHADVLDANERYVIISGCKESAIGHFAVLFVFSKTPSLTAKDAQKVQSVIVNNGLDFSELVTDLQPKNCRY